MDVNKYSYNHVFPLEGQFSSGYKSYCRIRCRQMAMSARCISWLQFIKTQSALVALDLLWFCLHQTWELCQSAGESCIHCSKSCLVMSWFMGPWVLNLNLFFVYMGTRIGDVRSLAPWIWTDVSWKSSKSVPQQLSWECEDPACPAKPIFIYWQI